MELEFANIKALYWEDINIEVLTAELSTFNVLMREKDLRCLSESD